MLIKISSTIATLILLTSLLAAGSQSRKTSLENFKREMMPQVGKKIAVVGVLKSGKLGWLVAFEGWGIYIKGSDMQKMNDLNRFNGQPVKAIGTLQYFPQPAPVKSDEVVAAPPEHFYFDVEETRVVSFSPSSRPKHREARRRKP